MTAASPKTLIIMDGRKGGVGTTLATKALLEHLHEAGVAGVRAYDTDGAEGDLARCYPEETIGVEAHGTALSKIIDDLLGDSAINLAVVDVGRQAAAQIDSWLYESGPSRAAREKMISLIYVYVLGPTPRSIKQLARLHDGLRNATVPHTLVVLRNFGVSETFELFDQSSTRAAISRTGALIADLPRMVNNAWIIPDTNSLRLRDFVAHALVRGMPVSYSARSHVEGWLRKTGTTFDALEPIAALSHGAPHDPVASPASPSSAPSGGSAPQHDQAA